MDLCTRMTGGLEMGKRYVHGKIHLQIAQCAGVLVQFGSLKYRKRLCFRNCSSHVFQLLICEKCVEKIVSDFGCETDAYRLIGTTGMVQIQNKGSCKRLHDSETVGMLFQCGLLDDLETETVGCLEE